MSTSQPSKRMSLHDALDFIMDGEQSDKEDLSSDEDVETGFQSDSGDEDLEECDAECEDERNEDGNEIAENGTAPVIPECPSKEHTFCWRNPIASGHFAMEEEIVSSVKSPVDYFMLFWTDELNDMVVDQTNLYSTQKKGSSITTNREEIEQLIVCS